MNEERKKLIIGKPSAKIENGEFIVSCELSGVENGECHYSVPEQWRELADSGRSDCFLVGLLHSAMIQDADIEVRGTVSEQLLFNLEKYCIPLVNGFDRALKRIHISCAATVVPNYTAKRRTGTGFSGGVDSFFTVYQRGIAPGTPADYKLDTLFFFNVGSHGMGHTPEKLKWLEDKFHARLRHLRGYADEIGMPLIPINSNVHKFHHGGHLQMETLATMSAALFVEKGVQRYYLASPGYTWHSLIRCSDTQNGELAVINGQLLPLIETEAVKFCYDGMEFSRIDKIRTIADYEPATRYLDVCGNQEIVDTNCTLCFKCKRTLMILDLLGLTDRFANRFDLKKYRGKEERRYIADLIIHRKDDLFLREMFEWTRENGINLRDKTTLGTILYMRFVATALYRRLKNAKGLVKTIRRLKHPFGGK